MVCVVCEGWDGYFTLALALVGKCAIGNSFCVIYLFSAELFPTEVRYEDNDK